MIELVNSYPDFSGTFSYKRIDARANNVLARFTTGRSSSIPQVATSNETQKSFYRLLNNKYFTEKDVNGSIVNRCGTLYANQKVSYLLQRIEDYPGLIILVSNFKSNMDDSFLRRFYSTIYFLSPKPAACKKLWQKTMPAACKPEPAINLNERSEKYDLNGAAILNIIHDATLKSLSRNGEFTRQADIIEVIRKEYQKEERSMN